MPKAELLLSFPALRGKKLDLSPATLNYNCLAYALGDTNNWWQPGHRFFYWPDGFSHDVSVETVTSIIKLHGYTKKVSRESVERYRAAVAIYSIGQEWTHFAKWSNGLWSSKIGEDHDIKGVTLEDLEGRLYGKVTAILCRPLSDKRA